MSSSKSKKQSKGTRRSLHVVIDREIDAQINAVVQNEGLSTSAVVRDALRAYFKLGTSRDRGWHEGFASAVADVQRRMREVLAGLEVENTRG